MRRIDVILIVVSIFMSSYSYSQSESFMQISVGSNFLTTNNSNPKFKTFGPSSIQRFPTIRIESISVLIEGNDMDYYLDLGFGLESYGYKIVVKEDSILYNKYLTLFLQAGIGATSYLLEDVPISFSVNFQIMNLGFNRVYLNRKVIHTDLDAFKQYSLSTRVDFRFIDYDNFRLSAFYLIDWGLTTMSRGTESFKYRTHSIGVSISFVNGFYGPIAF